MLQRRKFISLASAAMGTLLLPSCSFRRASFRYRLIVEVDTPRGVRSGSSVIQLTIDTTDGPLAMANGVTSQVKGEAVAVPVTNTKTLFALLATPESPDGAGGYPFAAIDLPPFRGPYATHEQAEYMADHSLSGTLPEKRYPLLVAFRDINDPSTVERVYPGRLDEIFGEGYAMRRIIVQTTQDPVTRGSLPKVQWLENPEILRNYRDRKFPDDVPVGDLTGVFQKGI